MHDVPVPVKQDVLVVAVLYLQKVSHQRVSSKA
jgi:hypothetical protein